MTKRPPVTIGLPFHNSARTLGDAIRSVFAQTYTDWELILVDDGSTDGSDKLVSRIKDPRVRIHADSANRGLAVRLNELAEMALGEYLVRMDADDIMHPQRLQRQLEAICANPKASIVATGVTLIDANGVPIAKDRPEPAATNFALLKGPQIVHPTVLARTEWFRRNPYSVDSHRAEDYELWCRTRAGASEVISLPESLHFYRIEFSWKKYISSLSTQARITLKRGPALTTWPATALLWLYVVAKMGLWSAAALFRLTDKLQEAKLMYLKRFQSLTPSEVEEARAVLAQIAATEVPGWPHAPATSNGVVKPPDVPSPFSDAGHSR